MTRSDFTARAAAEAYRTNTTTRAAARQLAGKMADELGYEGQTNRLVPRILYMAVHLRQWHKAQGA